MELLSGISGISHDNSLAESNGDWDTNLRRNPGGRGTGPELCRTTEKISIHELGSKKEMLSSDDTSTFGIESSYRELT